MTHTVQESVTKKSAVGRVRLCVGRSGREVEEGLGVRWRKNRRVGWREDWGMGGGRSGGWGSMMGGCKNKAQLLKDRLRGVRGVCRC